MPPRIDRPARLLGGSGEPGIEGNGLGRSPVTARGATVKTRGVFRAGTVWDRRRRGPAPLDREGARKRPAEGGCGRVIRPRPSEPGAVAVATWLLGEHLAERIPCSAAADLGVLHRTLATWPRPRRGG